MAHVGVLRGSNVRHLEMLCILCLGKLLPDQTAE